MGKIHIKELAEKMGMSVDDLLVLSQQKLTSGVTGTGRRTWFDDAAQEALALAREAPALAPTKLVGRVRRLAGNPSWVYVKMDGIDPLVPVAVPRRLRDKLLGKVIPVEGISDGSGEITYRYDYSPR